MDLLDAYIEGDFGATVKALAADVRALAYALDTLKNGTAMDADALARIEAGAEIPTASYAFNGEAGAYKIVGVNVNMDNKLSVVILMAANNGADLEALKNGYYVDGTSNYKAEVQKKAGVVVNGVQYMGVIVNVPISMYNSDLSFVIKDANGTVVSQTLDYNIGVWCYNMYHFANATDAQKNVVRAVYNLGVSAAAYKASL